jgi:hypothetical protein
MAAYAYRFPGFLGGVAEQNAYRYAAGLVVFSSGDLGNSQSSTALPGYVESRLGINNITIRTLFLYAG